MTKFLLALFFLSVNAFAKPAAIPAERLETYKNAVVSALGMVVPNEMDCGDGKSAYLSDTHTYALDDATEHVRQATAGTIDDEGGQPLLTFTHLGTTVSITTSSSYKAIAGFEVSYLEKHLVSFGDLRNPSFEEVTQKIVSRKCRIEPTSI